MHALFRCYTSAMEVTTFAQFKDDLPHRSLARVLETFMHDFHREAAPLKATLAPSAEKRQPCRLHLSKKSPLFERFEVDIYDGLDVHYTIQLVGEEQRRFCTPRMRLPLGWRPDHPRGPIELARAIRDNCAWMVILAETGQLTPNDWQAADRFVEHTVLH